MKFNKLNIRKFSLFIPFILVSSYLAYIDSFVLRLGYEIFVLIFILFLVLFRTNKTKIFLYDWTLFIAIIAIYEMIRSFADDYSLTRVITLNLIYNFENYLGVTKLYPYLQSLYLPSTPIKDLIIINIYSIFFYYTIIFSFLYWIIDRHVYFKYVIGLLILCYVGAIFFFLMPVSPPWMYASNTFKIERIIALIYEQWKFDKGIAIVTYLANGNAVAAFPSFHAAWVAYTSFFTIFMYPKKKYLWSLAILPVIVSFSVILGGEHFITDVIAGFGIAVAIAWFVIQKKFKFVDILIDLDK